MAQKAPQAPNEGFCFNLYDSLFGALNPFRALGPRSRGTAALGATVLGVGAAGAGLWMLHGQYQADLEQRREDYQEKYEKHLEKISKQKQIQEQKAAERAAQLEKKQKKLDEKKKQQAERHVSLQKEREQQRLDKEKEKQGVADAKKKAQIEKEKSPALIDVTNFFTLPETDIVAIVQESQATLIRDVQTFGPMAITGGRNATQPARRTAMRNQSIYNQISSVSASTFGELQPLTRLEVALWLAYFIRIKYADVTSRGLKRAELLRDNELVLRYLTFTEEDLNTFKRINLSDLYRTILDVSQVIDDLDSLNMAFSWIYNNSPLADFIANGGAESTEQPQESSTNNRLGDPSKRDEEQHAKTVYLSVPTSQRTKFQTNLDLYSLIALMPVSAILGRWDDFRKLTSDYLVYSPPGPNGGLEELQRSFSQLPHEPNIASLSKMATVFSPTVEGFGTDPDNNGISIPFADIPVPTAEMTQAERDEIQQQSDADTQKRFDTFVTQIKQSLTLPQDQSIPMEATQKTYELNSLSFKEYHIRQSIIDFDQTKSYHGVRSNLANYKSSVREPKLHPPGDKKIIIRGAVACIQDINTLSSVFHFGPYDGSKRYVFVSDTIRAVARTTVNQSQVFVLDQSEEDLYGRSTWTGYFRITQTPTGQTEGHKPTFSFYFNVSLECQRLLSEEEKTKADELLAKEALAKAQQAQEASEQAEDQAESQEKTQETTTTTTTTTDDTPAPVTAVEPVASVAPTEEKKVEEEVKPVEVNTTPIPAAPAVQETKPIVEEEKKVEVAPIAVVEEIKPIVEEIKPIVEEVKPVVEEKKVVVEEIKPIVEEVKPVVEEKKVVVEEIKPIVEEIKPVEEKKVVVEEIKPIVEETKPVVEETKPVAEEVIIEPEAAKVEETKPVVEVEETQPIVEEPVVEESVEVVEEPVVEESVGKPATVTEEPTIQEIAPFTEAAVVEEPVVEEPVVEESVVVVEEPEESVVVVEEPVAEESVVVVEEPVVEESVVVVEEPVVEESVVVVEEPIVEESVVVVEEPIVEESVEVVEEPVVEEPVVEESVEVVEEPVVEESVEEPAVEEPVEATEEPAAEPTFQETAPITEAVEVVEEPVEATEEPAAEPTFQETAPITEAVEVVEEPVEEFAEIVEEPVEEFAEVVEESAEVEEPVTEEQKEAQAEESFQETAPITDAAVEEETVAVEENSE